MNLFARSERCRRFALLRSGRPGSEVAPRATTIRIGTDIVEVAQIAKSIASFGDRYLSRVFTERELAYCMSGRSDPAPHLAARFAAKEATRKALKDGDEAVSWRSLEVARHPDGSCDMLLHGAASALAKRRGVWALSVTLSHDGAYATAVVAGQAWAAPGPARLARTTPRGAYER